MRRSDDDVSPFLRGACVALAVVVSLAGVGAGALELARRAPAPPAPVVIDMDAIAIVAGDALDGSAGQEVIASFTVDNVASTTISSTTPGVSSWQCNNNTATQVWRVSQGAAVTTNGIGPYCSSCALGPNFGLPVAKVFLLAVGAPASVQCSRLLGGATFGAAAQPGMTTGFADARYLELNASNDPLTGSLETQVVRPAVDDTYTLGDANFTYHQAWIGQVTTANGTVGAPAIALGGNSVGVRRSAAATTGTLVANGADTATWNTTAVSPGADATFSLGTIALTWTTVFTAAIQSVADIRLTPGGTGQTFIKQAASVTTGVLKLLNSDGDTRVGFDAATSGAGVSAGQMRTGGSTTTGGSHRVDGNRAQSGTQDLKATGQLVWCASELMSAAAATELSCFDGDGSLIPQSNDTATLGDPSGNFWASVNVASNIRGKSDAKALTISDVDGLNMASDTSWAQVPSGTIAVLSIPAGSGTTAPTKPACTARSNVGRLLYVDDNDDAIAGDVCVCVESGAGAFSYKSLLHATLGVADACSY